jgi:hypothetical protein
MTPRNNGRDQTRSIPAGAALAAPAELSGQHFATPLRRLSEFDLA